MLDPKSRALLLESLRPPEGGRLDIAIGTTFSLDLLALLTAPLAFTWFSWEDQDGRPTADPNALLEAIRRHADRIHIFCQAGQIQVPAAGRPLFAWLEPCVHEVLLPDPDGVFHPKVWVLRYRMPDETLRIRLLCLSRNLTFDRSWDTLLSLDGEITDRPQPVSAPAAAFIRRLPQLCMGGTDAALQTTLKDLVRDLERTRFELPDGFDSVQFWPLGIGAKKSWPFPDSADRLLVMSPFLTTGHLQRLASISAHNTLISRVDSLAALGPDDLEGYRCLALMDEADLDSEADAENGNSHADVTDETSAIAEENLSGLHAKLVIADIKDKAHVYTGSANATNAAFNRNVEFVVQLTGEVADCGTERILQHGGSGVVAFGDLLEEFTPQEPTLDDVSSKKLEQRLHAVRKLIIQAAPTGVIAFDDTSDETDRYTVQLQWTSTPKLENVAQLVLEVWPINLDRGHAQKVSLADSADMLASWSGLSFDALTRFFAFRITVTRGTDKATTAFVMNLPVTGMPEDRRARVLASMLKDKHQVLRFLLLLLAGEGVVSVGGNGQLAGPGLPPMGPGGRFQANLPVFESLLQALARDPGKLDQVAGFLAQLEQSEAGRALLPDGFEQIWAPLWAARQQLASGDDS